jgi:hypothetical protein
MLTVQMRAISKLMMLWLVVGLSGRCSLNWAQTPVAVSFDAPAIVVAEPINPSVVELPTMGGELVRLRIPVSTFQAPEFRGQVAEYVVEIDSPYQSMRMLDFWPKSEVYSEIDGNVAVESSQQRDRNLNFSIAGAYEPLGRGSVQGDVHSKSNVQERYQRKPAMQVLSASGTIQRGFGVFFKFRPGPLPVLEGVRDLAILAEVSPGWRADMLQIHLRAVGTTAQHSRSQTLGAARLWITTHREGDQAAASAATRYVTQERALRSLAASNQQRIDSKSLPTIWHKLGASLDVIEPKIPNDYLSQIIFGLRNNFYDHAATNRLPVDLRVAVLDYWDVRQALVELSTGPNTSQPRGVHVSFKD